MLWEKLETQKAERDSLKEEDDKKMTATDDPNDPITELFSCDHLMSNMSPDQDVQDPWDYLYCK